MRCCLCRENQGKSFSVNQRQSLDFFAAKISFVFSTWWIINVLFYNIYFNTIQCKAVQYVTCGLHLWAQPLTLTYRISALHVFSRPLSTSNVPGARTISLRLIKDAFKTTNTSPQGIAFDFAMRTHACRFGHFSLWFGANVSHRRSDDQNSDWRIWIKNAQWVHGMVDRPSGKINIVV